MNTAGLLTGGRRVTNLEMPAFDSKYVSLMVSGYDHYVNIPMASS